VIYEYRKYEAVPGKLGAIHTRFEQQTLPLFERHGVRVVGLWQPVVGELVSELHYMLKWESMAEQEECWKRFFSTGEWDAIVAETERDGPLIARAESQFWQPAPYAPMP
jgi:hypothetical protein